MKAGHIARAIVVALAGFAHRARSRRRRGAEQGRTRRHAHRACQIQGPLCRRARPLSIDSRMRHYDGMKMAGHMEYPKGGMGVHFVNLTIQGPLDPMRPNVLIYEPVGDKLELVAAEWLVPVTVAKERPVLFGQPFQGPMEGHEPLIPQGFVHYDLHAWLFKDNPIGMFSPTNPDVTCEGYDFGLLEHPTKIVEQ